MDYAQERIATLHDYGGADPPASAGRATVVVPMTEREYGGLAAERVLSGLERVDPGRVVVPLRAPAERAPDFADWLDSFSLSLEVLWCGGRRVADLLADHGLDGTTGKGRDVWLALGVADGEFVVLQDADAATYEPRDTRKLLYPLGRDGEGFSFAKGYYARVEGGTLYGRLNRLFYAPLVEALAVERDAELLDYLGAFRYALAGECAMTADLARSMRLQRRWGLEVGTLGEAFAAAGADGTAQVDLGRYEHDHRSVEGPSGLSEMAEGVGGGLFRALADAGVEVAFDPLRERYRRAARRHVRAYAADAGFNALDYDRSAETEQVEVYADAVAPPGPDDRLPAWRDCELDPGAVREAAAADLAAARGEA